MGDDEHANTVRWRHDHISTAQFMTMIRGVVGRTLRAPPPGYDTRADAIDDAVQDVLRHLLETPPPDSLRDYDAWACKAARNKTIDFLRTQRRATRNRQPSRMPSSDDDGDEPEGLEYYRPSIERDPVQATCELRETLSEILEAVEEAGERHSRHPSVMGRMLWAMICGLSEQETAEELHRTRNQVRNDKNRIILTALQEHFPELMAQYVRPGPKRGTKGRKSTSGKRGARRKVALRSGVGIRGDLSAPAAPADAIVPRAWDGEGALSGAEAPC